MRPVRAISSALRTHVDVLCTIILHVERVEASVVLNEMAAPDEQETQGWMAGLKADSSVRRRRCGGQKATPAYSTGKDRLMPLYKLGADKTPLENIVL